MKKFNFLKLNFTWNKIILLLCPLFLGLILRFFVFHVIGFPFIPFLKDPLQIIKFFTSIIIRISVLSLKKFLNKKK